MLVLSTASVTQDISYISNDARSRVTEALEDAGVPIGTSEEDVAFLCHLQDYIENCIARHSIKAKVMRLSGYLFLGSTFVYVAAQEVRTLIHGA